MAITSCPANDTNTKTCHESIADTAPRLPKNNHRTSLTLEKGTSLAIADTGDAIVAATAAEHNLTLATGNTKHFKAIKDLTLHAFKP